MACFPDEIPRNACFSSLFSVQKEKIHLFNDTLIKKNKSYYIMQHCFSRKCIMFQAFVDILIGKQIKKNEKHSCTVDFSFPVLSFCVLGKHFDVICEFTYFRFVYENS